MYQDFCKLIFFKNPNQIDEYTNFRYREIEKSADYLITFSDFSIITLNIRGIRNKLSNLEIFLNNSLQNETEVNRKRVDIIFICETFMKEGEEKFCNIENYQSFHFPRPNRLGGGVSFFVRNGIKIGKQHRIFHEENQFFILKLKSFNTKLCGVYKPPDTNTRNFLEKYDSILSSNKKMICMGDFNIDILSGSDELNNTLTSNSFIILNKNEENFYTRKATVNGRTSCTIIDHIHTDLSEVMNFNLQIDECGISDHRYLLLSFNSHIDNYEKTKITFRTFEDDKFEKYLNSIENDKITSFTDFHSYITNGVQKFQVEKI